MASKPLNKLENRDFIDTDGTRKEKTIFGGDGNDQFYVGFGDGDNLLTGGQESDRFWVTGSEANLSTDVNILTDFSMAKEDAIGFANLMLAYNSLGSNWNLPQENKNAIVEVFGQDVAILQGIQANSLSENNFVFG